MASLHHVCQLGLPLTFGDRDCRVAALSGSGGDTSGGVESQYGQVRRRDAGRQVEVHLLCPFVCTCAAAEDARWEVRSPGLDEVALDIKRVAGPMSVLRRREARE